MAFISDIMIISGTLIVALYYANKEMSMAKVG